MCSVEDDLQGEKLSHHWLSPWQQGLDLGFIYGKQILQSGNLQLVLGCEVTLRRNHQWVRGAFIASPLPLVLLFTFRDFQTRSEGIDQHLANFAGITFFEGACNRIQNKGAHRRFEGCRLGGGGVYDRAPKLLFGSTRFFGNAIGSLRQPIGGLISSPAIVSLLRRGGLGP